MDIGVISVRYARALLKAGLDAGVEDKVYAEMQVLVCRNAGSRAELYHFV